MGVAQGIYTHAKNTIEYKQDFIFLQIIVTWVIVLELAVKYKLNIKQWIVFLAFS